MLIRKKLNKSAIILIAILVIGAITAIVCHFVGVFDLSFVGDLAIAGALWASSSGWNVAIVGGVIFAIGMATTFWLKDYIIGTEIPMGAVAGSYIPQGGTVSPAQSNDSVVSA